MLTTIHSKIKYLERTIYLLIFLFCIVFVSQNPIYASQQKKNWLNSSSKKISPNDSILSNLFFIQSEIDKLKINDSICHLITNKINDIIKYTYYEKSIKNDVFLLYIYPLFLLIVGFILGIYKEQIKSKKQKKENLKIEMNDNLISFEQLLNELKLKIENANSLFNENFTLPENINELEELFNKVCEIINNQRDIKNEVLQNPIYDTLKDYFNEHNKKSILSSFFNIINKNQKSKLIKRIKADNRVGG